MWSLLSRDGCYLKPLTWRGGNQEKSVSEILNTFKNGSRIVSYISTCGSGKSSTILNVVKGMGRGIVVVPSKPLQKQYRVNYCDDKYLERGGKKMKITTMFGRDSIECKYLNGGTCATRNLPCNCVVKEGETRISLASKCKHYIPPPMILGEKNIDYLKDIFGEYVKYKAVDGGEYVIFRGKDEVKDEVCGYYKQFHGYVDSDVIIMNKWKWNIESYYGRKPLVDIECIDESDEFLSSLTESIKVSSGSVLSLVDDEILDNEIRDIFTETHNIISDTSISDDSKVNEGMSLINFIDNVIEKGSDNEEVTDVFFKIERLKEYMDKSMMSSEETSRGINIEFDIPYPDIMLSDMLKRSSQRILMCSATKLSDYVLENLYGLKYDKVVYGRRDQPGELILAKTKYGMLNTTYNNWNDNEFQSDYCNLLKYIVLSLIEKYGNVLVLTPGKKYVIELIDYIKYYIGKNDGGVTLSVDFSGENEVIGSGGKLITISHRMKRGVDLKGDLCRAVVWTKYPIPNISDGYVRSLFRRFNKSTWRILNDIAENDVIQGCCRGLRSDDDWCVFATPDIKAYDVVEKWWSEQMVMKNRRY